MISEEPKRISNCSSLLTEILNFNYQLSDTDPENERR